MPSTFTIDQNANFELVFALSCEPKIRFGTTDQEKTSDGTPKWELQVAASSRDGFGRPTNEILRVGINAPRNPVDGMPLPSPVQLVGLQVGVMDKTTRDRDTGVTQLAGAQVWYRAEAVRPANARPAKQENAA